MQAPEKMVVMKFFKPVTPDTGIPEEAAPYEDIPELFTSSTKDSISSLIAKDKLEIENKQRAMQAPEKMDIEFFKPVTLDICVSEKEKLAPEKMVDFKEIDEEETETDLKVDGNNSLQGTLSGWKNYMTHLVMKMHMLLACLYMTVLGFDSITLTYNQLNSKTEF